MKPGPRISVCIPLFNGMPYIREAIQSVMEQTYPDWELVITDDGSTDGSREVVQSFQDSRIRYLPNPTRLGAEGNWNRCVAEARGEYVKLLCHDDRIHPDCLSRQFAALESPGNASASFVACARRVIGPNGHKIITTRWKQKDTLIAAGRALRAIVRSGRNPVGEPCAVLFRRSDWERLGGFSAVHPYVIDLQFWTRLLGLGDCYYMADPLRDFRVSPTSWSSQLAREQAKHYQAFISSLSAQYPGQLSRFDVKTGMLNSGIATAVRKYFFFHARYKKY